MATVTSVIHFYATVFTVMLLVALSVAFRHATETHLEFEVANKDEEKKAGYLQSVALEWGWNSLPESYAWSPL